MRSDPWGRASMKRLSRWLSLGFVVLVVVLGVAVSLTIGWRPFLGPRARPLAGRKFEATPERLARGRYLANSLWYVPTAIRTTTGRLRERRRWNPNWEPVRYFLRPACREGWWLRTSPQIPIPVKELGVTTHLRVRFAKVLTMTDAPCSPS